MKVLMSSKDVPHSNNKKFIDQDTLIYYMPLNSCLCGVRFDLAIIELPISMSVTEYHRYNDWIGSEVRYVAKKVRIL